MVLLGMVVVVFILCLLVVVVVVLLCFDFHDAGLSEVMPH